MAATLAKTAAAGAQVFLTRDTELLDAASDLEAALGVEVEVGSEVAEGAGLGEGNGDGKAAPGERIAVDGPSAPPRDAIEAENAPRMLERIGFGPGTTDITTGGLPWEASAPTSTA